MSNEKAKDFDSEELEATHESELNGEDQTEAETELSAKELLEENKKLRDELHQKNDQILRKVAEFENLRKRTQRERVQLFDDAKINAIKDLLPVYDDLDRSISNIPENADDSFAKGVQMVYNKFSNVLEQMGVESINESGVPFDVDLHDALLRQPSPDKKTESNTVLQVLEPGYRLGEKVIRHAKVIVSE